MTPEENKLAHQLMLINLIMAIPPDDRGKVRAEHPEVDFAVKSALLNFDPVRLIRGLLVMLSVHFDEHPDELAAWKAEVDAAYARFLPDDTEVPR